MTLEEIKQAMADQGLTQVALAEKLGVSKVNLNKILSGKNPMTDALHNHITLLLTQPREAVLVYRVNVTEQKASELLGERCTVIPSDRATAIEAIIHHNLAELIQLGCSCTWSDEEKNFLGISKLELEKFALEMKLSDADTYIYEQRQDLVRLRAENKQLKASTPSQDIVRKKYYTAVCSDLVTAPPTPTTQEAASFSPSRRRKLAELEKKNTPLKHKRTVRFRQGRKKTKNTTPETTAEPTPEHQNV
jgi:transcriptional regulator with XRE-family HTH domain